jgi:hypothetical protein
MTRIRLRQCDKCGNWSQHVEERDNKRECYKCSLERLNAEIFAAQEPKVARRKSPPKPASSSNDTVV